MRIFRVGITYGELRSTGYPAFSNTRQEVTLLDTLDEGETAAEAVDKLKAHAKAKVEQLFGDPEELPLSEMQKPYQNPQKV